MSKKVPINPMLSQGLKQFVEGQSDEWGVSQSDLISKLIDAAQLYRENPGDDQKLDNFIAILGASLALSMFEYHLGEEGFPNFEPEKKARRFYVRPSQRDWMKERGGISDTVKSILAFYLFGVLDSYLPPEFEFGRSVKTRHLRENLEDVAEELTEQMGRENGKEGWKEVKSLNE